MNVFFKKILLPLTLLSLFLSQNTWADEEATPEKVACEIRLLQSEHLIPVATTLVVELTRKQFHIVDHVQAKSLLRFYNLDFVHEFIKDFSVDFKEVGDQIQMTFLHEGERMHDLEFEFPPLFLWTSVGLSRAEVDHLYREHPTDPLKTAGLEAGETWLGAILDMAWPYRLILEVQKQKDHTILHLGVDVPKHYHLPNGVPFHYVKLESGEWLRRVRVATLEADNLSHAKNN